MLKKIVFLCSILLSSAYAQAFDKNKINLAQSFWGNWGVFNPKSICTEHYHFAQPGKFVYQAQSKQLAGEFAVLRSSDKVKLDQLILEIQADNEGKGCGGDSASFKGQSSSFFLKWLSPDSAELCLDDLGQRCLGIYLNRK